MARSRDRKETTITIHSCPAFRFATLGCGEQASVGRDVFLVLADSPAAQAGLKPGDAILRIDDRPAASLTLDALRALFKAPQKTYRVEIRYEGVARVVIITTRPLL